MTRAVYYKGVRLWQHLQWIDPNASRTGASRKMGVTRTNGKLEPSSPNWIRDLSVYCQIDPVTALSGLTDPATLYASMLHEEARLIAVSKTVGSLAYVESLEQKADVSASFAAGSQVVTHGALGGSWTPAASKYVLFRKPSSGLGFVALATAVNPGVSITATLTEAIDNTWDVVNVQLHWGNVEFERMVKGRPNKEEGLDNWRADVEYVFSGEADATLASAYTPSLDET